MPGPDRRLQRWCGSGGCCPARTLLLLVLWCALSCAPAEGGKDDEGLRGALALVSAADIAVDAEALQALGPARRFGWLEARLEAIGLRPSGARGRAPLSDAEGRTHAVLTATGAGDAKSAQEIVLLCAPIGDATGTAILAHLGAVLVKSGARARRPIVLCGLDDGPDAAGAVAAHLGAIVGAEGAVVGALVLTGLGPRAGRLEIQGVRTYPVVRDHLARLLLEGGEDAIALRRGGAHEGTAAALRERGIPAFSVTTSSPSQEEAPGRADGSASTQAAPLARAARMVLRLSIGLAAHSEPLRDPLGVASYLIRAQPRFSVDDLLLDATTSSYRLKRGGRYAQRVDSGLSAVIVNVSEDLDPRAAWEALVGLEAQAGPVRYRVMRRTADIQAAYDDGAIALVPRLCCARGAHESPHHLPAAAAIGYRWLAPWSTGTRRRHEPCLVGPLAAAARRLPVILDAGDLPPVQHASLRKALRDRPALFLNLRSPDARGPALGDRTLPLTRFRLNSTWHSALDYPGMAAPVVYRPRGEQLAAAIAAWGAQEPAGWDAPGSAQREALCAALGGALIAWLAEVER